MQKATAALYALEATPEDVVMARVRLVGLDKARLDTSVERFKAFCNGHHRPSPAQAPRRWPVQGF